MKNTGGVLFKLLLFFFAVLLHMFYWIRYENYFPVYPEWFISLLLKICRPTKTYCGQETLYDLYFFFGSLINVSVLALVFYLLWNRFNNKTK